MGRALFVGRFQPFHRGHFKAVRRILDREGSLTIVVAAAQYSHTLKNPFTAGERVEMIHKTLREYLPDADVVVIPVVDIEDNALWVRHLERMLPPFDVVYSNNPLVRQLFIEAGYRVERIPLFNRKAFSAKKIRQMIIENDPSRMELVPRPVIEVILRVIDRFRIFRETDEPERFFIATSSFGGMRGKFIVLEGLDGSGKDELIPYVVALLINNGLKVRISREPTYRIRCSIDEFTSRKALAMLFAADRLENALHVRKFLERGYRIVQSRHLLSSLVYQGEDENDRERIYELNAEAIGIAKPDLILVIDVEPEKALERLSGKNDRFEQIRVRPRFEKLREKYLKASERLRTKGFNVRIARSMSEALESVKELLRAFSSMAFEEYVWAITQCLEGSCYDELLAYYKKALSVERDENDGLLIGFADDFEFALKAGLLIHRRLFLMDIFGPQLALGRPSDDLLSRLFRSIETLKGLSEKGLEIIYVPHRMILEVEFPRVIEERRKFLSILRSEDVRWRSLMVKIEDATGIDRRYLLGFVYAYSLGVSGFTVDKDIIYPSRLKGLESVDIALDGEFGRYRNFVYAMRRNLKASYEHLMMLSPETIRKMDVEDLLKIRERYPPEKVRKELENLEQFSGFSEGESPTHYLAKLTAFGVSKLIETAIGGFLLDALGLILNAIKTAFGRKRVSLTRYYEEIPKIVMRVPEETNPIRKGFQKIKGFFLDVFDELL